MPALPDSVLRKARTGVANSRRHGVRSTPRSTGVSPAIATPLSGVVDPGGLLGELPERPLGVAVGGLPAPADQLGRSTRLAEPGGTAVGRSRDVGGRGHQGR